MGKGKSNRVSGPRVNAQHKGPNPKQQKAAVAASEADKLRQKGFFVRRNRVHAATPPQRE